MNDYVQQGVKVLDANFPDWFLKIDLKVLDMGSMSRCIIGQLGVDDIFTYRSDYGFDIDWADVGQNTAISEKYRELDALWKEAILSKRKENDARIQGLIAETD